MNENLAVDICGSVCSNGHIRSTIYLMGGWRYFKQGVVLFIKANVLLLEKVKESAVGISAKIQRKQALL